MSPLHPPKEQLIAFGQGRLAPEESVRVEEHLEGCHDCCETLLDLTDDTFVELLKFTKSADAPEQPVVATRRPARGLSEPGTTPDHPEATSDESAHSATVLVQSGEPVVMDELPAELRDHPRYRIVELIGRGGMGHVYRAEHRLMNRPVAIKLISSQLVRHPHAVERFRREVQAAAKLSHPNIVTAYDAEQAGDVHFLVMEFVEGTDLASIVKQRGPMSVAEACECIRQAAVGLQHAHEKGMVHRDIKPHNLMLAAGGQVRILDFGLAGFASEATFGEVESSPVAPRPERRTSSDSDPRVQPSTDDPAATRNWLSCRGATGLQKTTAHLTTMGSVMGTPDYMAPEQAANAHAADIRADIYSLGCTLHFLLTGQPPFEADNVVAKLRAHAQNTPPDLTTLRDDVPLELAAVGARMMAKKPAERFQTPAEIVAALQACQQGNNASGRTMRVRLDRVAKVIGLVLAACVLLAGIIVLSTNRGWLEIRSQVGDLKVTVRNSGEQVEFSDLKTGSQVKWVPGGKCTLEVVGNRNDVKLDQHSVTVSRFGHVIVTATWNAAGLDLIRSRRQFSRSRRRV
jgi:serine/threonine protein kinase